MDLDKDWRISWMGGVPCLEFMCAAYFILKARGDGLAVVASAAERTAPSSSGVRCRRMRAEKLCLSSQAALRAALIRTIVTGFTSSNLLRNLLRRVAVLAAPCV